MGTFAEIVWTLLLGVLLGTGGAGYFFWRQRMRTAMVKRGMPLAVELLEQFFVGRPLTELVVSERKFPFRVRADLQQAVTLALEQSATIVRFTGLRQSFSPEGINLLDCLVESEHYSATLAPPEYEEVDVGGAAPVRCLKSGLWLLERQGYRYVIFLSPATQYGQNSGLRFQIAVDASPQGQGIVDEFFRILETAVQRAESYRGKILSLTHDERRMYTGQSTGIRVHRLRTVDREQVILPAKTLDLLDRNVVQFVQQRQQLSRYRQSTKKGLLFYGPPGTGKTHTIHYLAQSLVGHTTLLITAEQIGLLSEYMALARLLQPALVVMEDIDLVASQRESLDTCEEIVLNQLLNEMDGLNEDAEILFVLTTNRSEKLETALAARPGRIDQAIEFPLPDDIGRGKLIRLYAQGIRINTAIVEQIIRRTQNVSAAFIKELMRRSVQFQIERQRGDAMEWASVEEAIQEMLFSGGSLNLKLLGATGIENPADA